MSIRNLVFVAPLLVLTLAVLLAGCAVKGPETFGRDLDPSSVQNGMSRMEVEARLGVATGTERLGSTADGGARVVSVYAYQAPTSDGRFIFKELTLIYAADIVESKSFRERILLKPEKDVRLSNQVVELK